MKKLNFKMIVIVASLISSMFILKDEGVNGAFAKGMEEVIEKKSGLINETLAKEMMYNKVPNSKIVEFTYDEERFIPVFQGILIKNEKEYEILVDAKTGTILDYKEEKIERNTKAYEGKIITVQEAHEIILHRSVGGEIKGFKFDGDAEIPTYEGVVHKSGNEIVILLDARDGKIIGIDRDDVKRVV
ncbi:MAG: PepSY domain-containing protein [Clostridium sp.]